MKIKLYKLTELKKMHATDIEKDYVYGIRKKDYQQMARRPREVIEDTGYSYYIKNWGYIIPYEYVKEIIHED